MKFHQLPAGSPIARVNTSLLLSLARGEVHPVYIHQIEDCRDVACALLAALHSLRDAILEGDPQTIADALHRDALPAIAKASGS